jgi:starch synthase
MKVLYVAAEAVPLVKVGGLGDVAGSLPQAIKKLGVDIRLAIPWHKEIDVAKWGLKKIDGVGETRLGNSEVPVYLLARDEFAKVRKHKAIEGTKKEEKRFSKFSESILEFIKSSDWKPDVFHGNDWHVTDALVKFEKATQEDLINWGYSSKNLATLLTVHNLKYHSKVLGVAIQTADLINAVSPSYAKEILTPRFCAGLCEDLIKRRQDIHGVLNGIDYKVWNPERDDLIFNKYGRENWKEGKKASKKVLQEKLGLKDGGLMLGFVGRLDPGQKGVRLLVNAMERVVGMGCRVVILGTGNPKIEKQVKKAGDKYKGRVSSNITYDEQLAHEIYAGVDGLLIPSKYEPCGLIQMIGMAYGTLPIAHAVGGLKDTIKDGKTGFLYREDSSRGLVAVVKRAKKIFEQDRKRWEEMVKAAMAEDFSWDQSAKEYLKLYEMAISESRKSR